LKTELLGQELIMALFSKKAVTCPLCNFVFGKDGAQPIHFLSHAILAEGGGYMPECSLCGESDGNCEQSFGVMTGIVVHLRVRHNFVV